MGVVRWFTWGRGMGVVRWFTWGRGMGVVGWVTWGRGMGVVSPGSGVLLGAVGNGFALWIFCLHLRPWRSSTVLLFSLALADVMLLVALPFRISYYNSNFNWNLETFFATSVTSLLICMWSSCSLVLNTYTECIFTLNKSNQGYCGDFNSQCERNHTISWHRLAFLSAFYVPFLVIFSPPQVSSSVCGKDRWPSKLKLKKHCCNISIVILFAVCFLPSNVTQLVIWSKVNSMAEQHCGEIEQMTTVYYLTVSLTYLNSSLDPVVYFFSSSMFRSRCREVLGLQPSLDSSEPEEMSLPEASSRI
ncbi:hypothetical protein WMY93_028463 [Mugilogobius chulae]|uniref:G-protein coupled receptors family 1 profile domain-containing protein n=1 Tax=Mugilogobius chulae TaxID=88201 RepID=A0AAW0MX78_9GOBI